MAKQKEIEVIQSEIQEDVKPTIKFDNRSGCVSVSGVPESEITIEVNGDEKTLTLDSNGNVTAYFKSAEDFIIKIIK